MSRDAGGLFSPPDEAGSSILPRKWSDARVVQ